MVYSQEKPSLPDTPRKKDIIWKQEKLYLNKSVKSLEFQGIFVYNNVLCILT